MDIKPYPPRRLPPEVDPKISANTYRSIASRLRHYVGGERITNPNEWGDRYRALGKGSNVTRWSTDMTPYLREIGEVLGDDTNPAYKHIVISKCSQVGASELILNYMLMKMEQDPCSILMFFDTEAKAKGWARTRLKPALQRPPFNDVSDIRPVGDTLQYPGGFLNWYGGNSSSGLRSNAARIVVADEISAFPSSVGQEGDWLSLAAERTSTFKERGRVICLSTPTTLVMDEGSFHNMVDRGDRRNYYVPCMHCGWTDWLWEIDHVFRYEEEGETLYGLKCPECGGITREGEEREEAVARGEWRATKICRPGFVSFEINGLHSPWKALDELYNRYEECMQGTGGALQSFLNTKLGKFYSAPEARTPLYSAAGIRMTKDFYKAREVPDEACMLVMGIDVQEGYLVWEMRAFGKRFENWSIDKGHVKKPISNTNDIVHELKELAAREYPRADGRKMKCRMMAIDYSYQPKEVIAVLNHFPKPDYDDKTTIVPQGSLMAVMGARTVNNSKAILGTPADRDARGQKKRTHYFTVGTDFIKKIIYRSLTVPEDEDEFPFGKMHAPTHKDWDEAYFKELTIEQMVVERSKKTGDLVTVFRKPSNARNEALDVAVYAFAAMTAIGADEWTEEQWDSRREYESIAAEKKGVQSRSPEQIRADLKQKSREHHAKRRELRLKRKLGQNQ